MGSLSLPGLMLLASFASPVDDGAAKEPAAGCEERYQALEKRKTDAEQQFMQLYRAAKTDEERQKAFEARVSPQSLAPEFLALAKDCAGSETEYRALVWVATNCRFGEELGTALEQLAGKHIEREGLESVLRVLPFSRDPVAEKLLRRALEKSPHREVKGYACYSLALYLKRHASTLRYLRNNTESDADGVASALGRKPDDPLLKASATEIESEIASLLERVQKDFADVEGRRATLGEAAERELYEIRNLAIGKAAPEIDGEDIFGERFKLSDYRGKVVVLDFWGHW